MSVPRAMAGRPVRGSLLIGVAVGASVGLGGVVAVGASVGLGGVVAVGLGWAGTVAVGAPVVLHAAKINSKLIKNHRRMQNPP